jgi:hypothetical protein
MKLNSYEKYMKLPFKERSKLSKKHHEEIMYYIDERNNYALSKYWKEKGGSFWKWLDERGLNEVE